ncbi:MAG: hypothetical protein A3D92_23510, partial [Bacteroidetes bacterium RIFCSPHIGHO2_02_FULL_44_7]
MESFKRRLKYYGIGFGFGLIFIFFFFQNRGCSWLPSNRVKNAVLDRLLVVSDETQGVLDKKKISDDDLILVLNDGDVDFSNSSKDKKDKVYILVKDGIHFAFTLPNESFISEVFVGAKNGRKITGTKEGTGRIIRFPIDEDLVFPDSTAAVTCQQTKLGLINPREILRLLKKSGRVDFEKCELTHQPKPLHYL